MSSVTFVTWGFIYSPLKLFRLWKKKSISPQALAALEKTNQYLSVGHYSPLTVRSYLAELRYIFVYYQDADPVGFTDDMILIDTDECPFCKRKSLKLLKVFYPWKKGDDG